MQVVLKEIGGQMQHAASLKLHRPLSAYTAHPRWQELAGPACSFAQACDLLAGGLAADFEEAAPAADSGDAPAQPAGSNGDTSSDRSAPGAPARHQHQQGPSRVARWLEYPAGSQQYATLISQRAINNRKILLAGAVCWPWLSLASLWAFC